MVCIVLDMYDEKNPVFASVRKAPSPNKWAIEEGIQLAQVTARQPHVYTVPNNGSEHVFFSTSLRNARD
jgi:hypothetical protein